MSGIQQPPTVTVGAVFGSLTAKSHVVLAHGDGWYCDCDCGEETVVYADDLLRGRAVGCGFYDEPGRRHRIRVKRHSTWSLNDMLREAERRARHAARPLTERQRDVLVFIERYTADRRYPPAYRDIMEEFGFSSTNAARWFLWALEIKGYIEIDRFVSRGIRVLRGASDVGDDTVKVAGHGMATGDGPFQLTTSGGLPTGLSLATDYWAIRVDDDHIKFATSAANAAAGTAVNLTGIGPECGVE